MPSARGSEDDVLACAGFLYGDVRSISIRKLLVFLLCKVQQRCCCNRLDTKRVPFTRIIGDTSATSYSSNGSMSKAVCTRSLRSATAAQTPIKHPIVPSVFSEFSTP